MTEEDGATATAGLQQVDRTGTENPENILQRSVRGPGLYSATNQIEVRAHVCWVSCAQSSGYAGSGYIMQDPGAG